MPIQLRLSNKLKRIAKDLSDQENMYLRAWIEEQLESVLSDGFPSYFDRDYVLAMLKTPDDRMILELDPKILHKVDRTARKQGLTRTEFILLTMVAGATASDSDL